MAMTASERNGLRRSHEKMSDLVRAGNRSGYADANTLFHDLIYTGAHNAILEGFARDLRRRLMPFRRAQFNTIERLGLSFAEHGEIVVAIERGQGDEAGARMRYHMRLVEAAFEGLTLPPT
jgi:DNA-binding GntR family transcriptional regulator